MDTGFGSYRQAVAANARLTDQMAAGNTTESAPDGAGTDVLAAKSSAFRRPAMELWNNSAMGHQGADFLGHPGWQA